MKSLSKTKKASPPKRNSSPRKDILVWAIDPTQNPKECQHLLIELKIWARQLRCDIQPVAVFSDAMMNLPSAVSPPWSKSFAEYAQDSLAQYIAKTKMDVLPGETIILPTFSTRKMATELASYALSKEALIIFANTRARQSWNPFRLGSFAETLVSTSEVPVLLMNPKAKPSIKNAKVLFPTDLNHTSRNALLQFEPWAAAFGSKILLYNQVESPQMYMTDFSGNWQVPAMNMETMTKYAEGQRQKKANEWKEMLERDNLECTTIVQRQSKYLGTEIVELAARKKVDLIVMAHQSGPVAQSLLGSTARDVLLRAHCPVLTFYRPKARKNKFVRPAKQRATKMVKQSPSSQLTGPH